MCEKNIHFVPSGKTRQFSILALGCEIVISLSGERGGLGSSSDCFFIFIFFIGILEMSLVGEAKIRLKR